MKNKQTPGAFGNKNGKKLTLKTQIGGLVFTDKKLRKAVATPEHPNGYVHTTPFEMGEYFKQLKADDGTPKTIDKILTFNYVKRHSSELGNYLSTFYAYEDANYCAGFLELKPLSAEKIEERERGLEINAKFFSNLALFMEPGGTFTWKDYGYTYEINEDKQYIAPHIEAFDTMRGQTPISFHNKIILKQAA